MMADKSMGILLMLFFGVSGAAILLLAWLEPMPLSDRIITTIIGSFGIIIALGKVLFLSSLRVKTNIDTGQVKVEVEDVS